MYDCNPKWYKVSDHNIVLFQFSEMVSTLNGVWVDPWVVAWGEYVCFGDRNCFKDWPLGPI